MNTLALLVILGIYSFRLAAQGPLANDSAKIITDQKTLSDAFFQFAKSNPAFVDARLRSQGMTLKEVDQQLHKAVDRGLLQSTKEKVQQVIEGSPSPQPIVGGQIRKVLPDAPTLIMPLTPSEASKLETLAASVGRIERLDGHGGSALVGTAFVINDQEVATNCHVIRAITIAGALGKELSDPASLRVDFGDNPDHDMGREFGIVSVAGCPSRLGLDVGILKVEARSSNQVNRLPAKLPFVGAAPAGLVGRRVALVGYPNLRFPSDPLFKKLSAVLYAKVQTLGVILDVVNDTNGKFQYIHHTSDSDSGNSGSPLIDLTGENLVVLGIHNCCYDPTAQQPRPDDPMPCSFVSGLTHRNSAIAVWELPRDPILGPLINSLISGKNGGLDFPD
jgi:hypothetical protein